MSKATLNGTFLRCALASLLLAGCGGDGTGPKPPEAVASVEVAPGADTLLVGQTTQFTVKVKDAGGSVLTGRDVTWRSDNEAVATVSTNGMVTALSAGNTAITATSEGKSGRGEIMVVALFRDSVAIAYTGDPKVPVVAAAIDGTRMAFVAGDGPAGLGGVVVTAPNGETMTTFVDATGLPTRAVVGDRIFLFDNYTDRSVDIAMLLPDGTITIKREVPVDPALLASVRQASANLLSGNSLPQMYSASASLDLPSLSTVFKVGAGIATIAGCAAGFVLASPTVVGAVAVAASCASGLVSIGLDIAGKDAGALVGSGSGFIDGVGLIDSAVGCYGKNPAECAALVAGVSEVVFGTASDLLDSRKSDVERAEKELANEGPEPGPPGPDPSPPVGSNGKNGKIAFTRDGGYGHGKELWTVNPDGTEETHLPIPHAEIVVDPDWSPDGSKIVYVDFLSVLSRFYTINADGTGDTPLSNIEDGAFPAWSPDGSKIAFVCRGLCVIGADGTGQTVLVKDSAFSEMASPSWSPDGKLIVFSGRVYEREDCKCRSLYVVNADGTGLTLLKDAGDAGIGHYYELPSWSPDGTKIVFTGSTVDRIKIINADGSGEITLPKTSDFYGASWSPDGSKLVAVGPHHYGYNNTPSGADIWIMNPDGTGRQRLMDTVLGEKTPSWGPAPR